MPIIAPSLLASNFLQLKDEAAMLNASEAKWFHLDVMDGRFVPNISFGLPIIKQLRKTTEKVFDVHLMIEEPEKYAEAFKHAGADILTVHYEACTHLHRNIEQIKSLGMRAGVALNPHTSVGLLENVLQDVDMVLIMSVNPGFGGQHFIPQTLEKVSLLKQMITQKKLHTLIEIDGGVTLNNASALVQAGADVLVAGSTVFNSANPLATIAALKNC
ncbi:MAG: ribulose-phosphate 3-epimerase [Flavobacterium sp.]|nr:ribulose-phosphate 3-epimerase [Flavobacterium sp.]